MRFDPIPFDLLESLVTFGKVVGVFVAAICTIWLIAAIAVRGPVAGVNAVLKSISEGFEDLFSMSPKRVLAISSLTFKESVRRKALLVFVVFAVLFMFGAWFLPSANARAQLQSKVHVSFVLTSISWLLIPVMLLLACWGIPEDIRLRSLHTVVTKPARRLEIVLGRMLGYSTVGLLLLAVMSAVGYVWLAQVMDNGNELAFSERMQLKSLNCRVPVYGKMNFLDREGRPSEKGINVGDRWNFRGYVEGATKSRAVWQFEGLSESDFGGEGMTLESMFEAFRTVKGADMSKGLIAQYTLLNDGREKAFGSLAKSELMREAADFMRSGQFDNAADSLVTAAETLKAGAVGISDLNATAESLDEAAEVVLNTTTNGDEEWKDTVGDSLADVAAELRSAAGIAAAVEVPEYDGAAESVTALAEAVRKHATDLKAGIPRIQVPLPPFEVREYRDGENVINIERSMSFEGDDEDVVRFLSRIFSELNEEGSLADDKGLSREALDKLVTDNMVSRRNADSLEKIFAQLVTDGGVSVADGKLEPADGQTFYSLFDKLAAEGKVTASDGWKLKADLFKDLMADGNLTVSVACQSLMQYIGMARPDLFIRLPDRPFWQAYGKSILAIGMMLVLIVALGVTASCFVKGPVAILLTSAFVVFGKPLHSFMSEFVRGDVLGGGLFSAAYRLVNHMNQMVDIEASDTTLKIIDYGDRASNAVPWTFSHIIPNFNYYTTTAEFVENGFDVPWNAAMLPCIATTLAFLIPCVIIGLFTLKYRELEAK